MAGIYYNRYATFASDASNVSVPYVKLPEKGTDKFTVYQVGKSRLDKLSQEYYSSPYFGFLILIANPEYGGTEWNIPNNTSIRIPYPLQSSIDDYKSALNKLSIYYGD